MAVKFESTHDEMKAITTIARRATKLFKESGVVYSVMDCSMDIEATHCNGNPLKLDELLDADEFNFIHDVAGIRNHINRNTGVLEDCFLPRYSK